MSTETAIDIYRETTLEAAIDVVSESMRNRLMNGYYVRSISHAADPDGGEKQWSVIVVYGEVGPGDE
jgi:hypothetical protein